MQSRRFRAFEKVFRDCRESGVHLTDTHNTQMWHGASFVGAWLWNPCTADQGTAMAFSSRTAERAEQRREESKVRPVRAVMHPARVLWALLYAT